MGFLAMIGQALLKTVLPTLATVLSGYILRLLHVQLQKAKIQLTAEQEAQIAAMINAAILAVEERARRNPNMTSAQKEAEATRIVAIDHPEIPSSVVKQMIDAALPEMRAKLAAGSLPEPITLPHVDTAG